MGVWAIAELRKGAYYLARAISEFLEPPELAIDQLKFEPARSAAVKIALDAGWIQSLRDGRPHTSNELVIPGQSEELLIRTFRVLTASKLVTEVSRQIYIANKRTGLLLENGVQAGLSHWFDNMAPVFVQLPSYFATRGFHEPSSQEAGPYAERFGCTYWQRVNQSPKLKDDFDTYMAAHKKGGSSIVDLLPVSYFVEGYDKNSSVLLVDIGGGVGHQSRELKSRHPYLEGEIIVQDLRVSKELEFAGIRGMEYDFFTPQPIRNARFYYYSAILHDWPDKECVDILKIVADAMRPGYSKLLINGIILRETGATYFEACKDFGMMAAMSAKEITLPQMIGLGAEAGLRCVGQHIGQHADNGIIEFERRWTFYCFHVCTPVARLGNDTTSSQLFLVGSP